MLGKYNQPYDDFAEALQEFLDTNANKGRLDSGWQVLSGSAEPNKLGHPVINAVLYHHSTQADYNYSLSVFYYYIDSGANRDRPEFVIHDWSYSGTIDRDDHIRLLSFATDYVDEQFIWEDNNE